IMNSSVKDIRLLEQELEEVRQQLEEAHETIEAIRSGQVDALVVHNNGNHQVYTLQTADRAYRMFIEKMTEGAITLNSEGIIVYANSRFAEMMGVPHYQVIGVPFDQFVLSTDRNYYKSLFTVAWKEDTKGEVILASNKNEVPVLLSLTALEISDGSSLSIVITDLTVQKTTQRQLENNNKELEDLNKKLEANNHDLQQFASVASHDLQEPVRKIQMYASLVQASGEGKLDAENMQYLGKVLSAADRMRTLVSDVLTYSSLSSGRGEFDRVNLNVVVDQLMEDFELVIAEKKAWIIHSELPVVHGNKGQLQQVFQNLLSNALKFSKRDSTPIVEITAKRVASNKVTGLSKKEGDFWLISIKDNGIGFDE
ncbi:MAG: PAS domain-containing sensor histidine kinase, partial [Chitinophagaceae bacterium]